MSDTFERKHLPIGLMVVEEESQGATDADASLTRLHGRQQQLVQQQHAPSHAAHFLSSSLHEQLQSVLQAQLTDVAGPGQDDAIHSRGDTAHAAVDGDCVNVISRPGRAAGHVQSAAATSSKWQGPRMVVECPVAAVAAVPAAPTAGRVQQHGCPGDGCGSAMLQCLEHASQPHSPATFLCAFVGMFGGGSVMAIGIWQSVWLGSRAPSATPGAVPLAVVLCVVGFTCLLTGLLPLAVLSGVGPDICVAVAPYRWPCCNAPCSTSPAAQQQILSDSSRPGMSGRDTATLYMMWTLVALSSGLTAVLLAGLVLLGALQEAWVDSLQAHGDERGSNRSTGGSGSEGSNSSSSSSTHDSGPGGTSRDHYEELWPKMLGTAAVALAGMAAIALLSGALLCRLRRESVAHAACVTAHASLPTTDYTTHRDVKQLMHPVAARSLPVLFGYSGGGSGSGGCRCTASDVDPDDGGGFLFSPALFTYYRTERAAVVAGSAGDESRLPASPAGARARGSGGRMGSEAPGHASLTIEEV